MWNHEPWRVIVPYYGFNNLHTVRIRRVGYLETDVLMGGKFHPKLNIYTGDPPEVEDVGGHSKKVSKEVP